MEDSFSFLPVILTYIGFLSLALLTLTIPKNGRIIAHYINLIATLSIYFLIDSSLTYQLTELFVVSGVKLEFILVVGIFNILMAILNGSNSLSAVKNSILISFMFLGSIFFIGSTDFTT